MRVSWQAPSDDGGSPITGYVVEIRDYNRKSWKELDTVRENVLSYLSTKLDQGTRYSYRISAENKYGRSDPVEIAEPVEAKYQFNVPDAPQNCQAKDITKSSCVITFDAPKSDGGSPIIGYVIERKQTLTSKWIRLNNEPISALTYKCNDLIDDLEYEFRVLAENKAGLSEPSEPCKPFTAKDPFTRPGPPENLKVGEVTKNSIELTWSKPSSDGGSPIKGYRIEKRNPKNMKWVPLENLGRITQCAHKIDGLTEGKEFEFRVIAFNEAGDSDPSAATPLIVAKTKVVGDKPTLLEPMKDIKVMAGERAHFFAKVKANPMPEISWYLDERLLNMRSEDVVATYDNNTLELTINNVQPKDQGVYKVKLTNPLGELTTDAKLTVLKKPTIKYDPKLDKTIDVIATEQNMHISCEISGFPKPDVKWYKEGAEIVPGGEVSRAITDYGEMYATINLNKIKRNEGGNYKVVAENEVGRAEVNFVVRVLDVPMPPESLTTVEITSYSCKLQWKPPKNDGNSPVLAYHIEKYDPKRLAYVRLDKTTLTEHYVDKLTKGQTYKFRVLAENRIGVSEPCEMEEPMVARGKYDVPGPPGIPDVLDLTDTSCRLKWDAPRNDGGLPIRGYFVEKKSGSKWVRVNKQPISDRQLVVKDLDTGSTYEFRVCAVNDEGEGKFSKESVSVTIKSPFAPPDPPIDLDVSNITKSSCLLTWRPPFRTGGQPITRYHVEMRTRGEYKFVRFTDDFISECEYEVRDLVENQEYEFRVIAENKIGESAPSEPTMKFKARDQVHGVAPEIEPLADVAQLIGSSAKIKARVLGTPVPDLKWKKGARYIKLDSSKYSITFAESVAVLLINQLNEEDAGQYTLEAENSEGSDSKSCKLTVHAPPKIDYDKKYKKTSVVSVGSNFRFVCQITGCPNPEVVCSKDETKLKRGDKPNLDSPTDNQYYFTIKQCDRNDSGVYTIRASNQFGKDECKIEVQVVDVPDQPKGPLEITLEVEQARSATLSWKPPKWDGGSELTGYTIEYAKIADPNIKTSIYIIKCSFLLFDLS